MKNANRGNMNESKQCDEKIHRFPMGSRTCMCGERTIEKNVSRWSNIYAHHPRSYQDTHQQRSVVLPHASES
jgi:hypothetical protein